MYIHCEMIATVNLVDIHYLKDIEKKKKNVFFLLMGTLSSVQIHHTAVLTTIVLQVNSQHLICLVSGSQYAGRLQPAPPLFTPASGKDRSWGR